jgi:hypothetical protein
MDVFGTAVASAGDFLRDAAIDAGHELGLYAVLGSHGPLSVDALARILAVEQGARRLRALADALVVFGVLARRGRAVALAGEPPPRAGVVPAGWGRIAEVIRTDHALPAEGVDTELRYHRHLLAVGAAPARELSALLPATSLLDLGGGAGAYAAGYLATHPGARVTLVDHAAVIALAERELAPLADRVQLIAGDVRQVALGEGYGAALLSNLLHLHPPAVCAELCALAARAVAPGGVVAIRDLRIAADRSGPLEGVLFALNMAIYTPGGDVYPIGQLRAWLEDAGLVDVEVRSLDTAREAVVVLGKRPLSPIPQLERQLASALARTGKLAWRELRAAGTLRADARPAPLAFPRTLQRVLARAVAVERLDATPVSLARATTLERHYTEHMPRMLVTQRVGAAEPAAALLRHTLAWSRLPRLARALDALFGRLARAGVDATPALGAPDADAFRTRTPDLATLCARTYYGGCMPLLYGYPDDLAYFAARGAELGLDLDGIIDRYLVAPVLHELCHFARDREALPPHLDECVAGWLGVEVWPEFAYPEPGHDDAIYAAPWLAQIGQALARAFGVDALVCAQAGAVPWADALPATFVEAAIERCAADWRVRRTSHFLSDTFDPAPWVALALAGGLPADDAFDRAIVADGLRAMCLVNSRVAGSFRTRTELPEVITIDDAAITAPARSACDRVAPRYWLPPAVGARMREAGLVRLELHLRSLTAIPAAADAIAAATPRDDAAFTLRAR